MRAYGDVLRGICIVNSSLSQVFYDAGQELAAVVPPGTASGLNLILNRFLGWPFHAATGFAIDSEGQKTETFATLIYTRTGNEAVPEPVEVGADSLACVLDLSETMDSEVFCAAYERVVRAKKLKKSAPPQMVGVPHTTITLGVIVTREVSVPVETLAEELDRLNRQTPSEYWPDMVVVLSKGTISYAMQFPGDRELGDLLPPGEGALASYIPPIYVIVTIRPTGAHTFNRMCAYIIAHLAIFSPGAGLPNWMEILQETPKDALVLSGYQYNLRGKLLPVPRRFYNDRYLPPPPLRIEDPKGTLLSTIEFLPWQDGGVVLLRGKLPLEGLLVFLGKEALKGKVNRNDLQISYVLPVTQPDFDLLLQRIQKQSNMRVRNDTTQWVVQKFADEGSSSPFMARLFLGNMRLREAVFRDPVKRAAFDKAYEFVLMTLLTARGAAQSITKLFSEHAEKVARGQVARVQGQALHIDENIDKELRKETENFINSSVRVLKQGMQDLTNTLGINIAFLFRKAPTFASGVANLEASDADLAEYLRQTRRWSERLIECRNAMEHNTSSVLPRVQYSQASDSIHAHEPIISGQPVTEFVTFIMDRVTCFVEEVTAHCLQMQMPAELSIREIPLAQRLPEAPERFQNTLKHGGVVIWRIAYHQTTFEET
jgi:hypothetical protein